ncbi:hypothetical protein [Sphingomonas colocasiae]|uniref:Hedgehog/Intein (Hint) domain-containing protein n=1 Tax=Sphingomonas colocasiae TaxID=1848973 RepID=A0ABS7PME4_9SPHN|nr:hypothetical protein [Sphingomonas colocasiae]MBY8821880.1 hypothetical protein [Sphingomonas colocasiae]
MAYAFPSGRRMFFVRELHEPVELRLRVVIAEGGVTRTDDGIFMGERTEIGTIDVNPAQPVIELVWDNYATYLVQAEHFHIAEDVEPASMLSERGASPLLDYVRETTFAEAIVGELRHWTLSCMHHIIHVVSAIPPEIRVLPPGGVYSIR